MVVFCFLFSWASPLLMRKNKPQRLKSKTSKECWTPLNPDCIHLGDSSSRIGCCRCWSASSGSDWYLTMPSGLSLPFCKLVDGTLGHTLDCQTNLCLYFRFLGFSPRNDRFGSEIILSGLKQSFQVQNRYGRNVFKPRNNCFGSPHHGFGIRNNRFGAWSSC